MILRRNILAVVGVLGLAAAVVAVPIILDPYTREDRPPATTRPATTAKAPRHWPWSKAQPATQSSQLAGAAATQTAPSGTRAATNRPANWAQPISKPGLGNLWRVSDYLYRGEQPDKAGWAELKAMGVKTVVNLRWLHSDKAAVTAQGMGYEQIQMKAWWAEDEDIVAFLKIVMDKNRTPVFVHCQHGADRTGTMCAVYRIVMQGWSKEEALREMRDGGYGFHETYQNLVKHINALDVDKIKKQAGLAQ